jgi:hypothetical protein
VNGKLLVVAAVVCTAATVVGATTTAAVVGPSDVDATVGSTMHVVGSFIVCGGVQAESAPATFGTMASEASAKLDPMINRLAHMV